MVEAAVVPVVLLRSLHIQLLLPHIQSRLDLVEMVDVVDNRRVPQLQVLTEMIQHLLTHLQKF
jgi:hypothetical protein